MHYEITENFEVKIFNDGEEVPFWYQPDYPNGDKFDDEIEAENWAKLAIASFVETEPLAPVGKNLAGEPKEIRERVMPGRNNVNLS